MSLSETNTFRLGKKSRYWLSFLPTPYGVQTTWHLQITSRTRGSEKIHAVVMETTPLKPLVTVTIKGETFPLAITWFVAHRGGSLCFGGERKIGTQGTTLSWEVRWRPAPNDSDTILCELRLRAMPWCEGEVTLQCSTPLPQVELWQHSPVRSLGHSVVMAWSAYCQQAFGLIDFDFKGDGNTPPYLSLNRSRFPLGGGKAIRFALSFTEAVTLNDARDYQLQHYVHLADSDLQILDEIEPLNPSRSVAYWLDPERTIVKGVQRLYVKTPHHDAPSEMYTAGFPYYPLGALKSLWDWGRFHPDEAIGRLVRFGATGIATDFQVMGTASGSEPNKGAFWDCQTNGVYSDFAGQLTHGIASNARMAYAFFLLDKATGDALARQSALNICQWLMLKQNDLGGYDGEYVHATRGLSNDGKFLPGSEIFPSSTAETILPFVHAFRATHNEVFIKSAWKVANSLLDRLAQDGPPMVSTALARLIVAFLALDIEAPNERLRIVLTQLGISLRAIPLDLNTQNDLNNDGLSSGVYECAEAAFLLHALRHEPGLLRYGFAALQSIPTEVRAQSWHAISAWANALLSVAALIPDASVNFDSLTVTLDWRVFAPEAAAQSFLQVQAIGSDEPVDYLPLVCRGNDQLLLIVLAKPSVTAVTVLKNGKCPVVRNLIAQTLDIATELHPIANEGWANVGFFTIDP